MFERGSLNLFLRLTFIPEYVWLSEAGLRLKTAKNTER